MSLEDDKELIRQRIDFVALVGETVVLRQRSGEFWGCCPFHQEKTPSFKVNPSTGLWKCFGCGKGGDIFNYVMEREHLEFMDALRYLAERAGIEISTEMHTRGPRRNRIKDALAEATTYFQTMLLRSTSNDAQQARNYLHNRGFGIEVCKRWGLGYAPGHGKLIAHLRDKGFSTQELLAADLAAERSGRIYDRFFDRVMFPIFDEHGSAIGFGGRVLKDANPKYLNSRDTNVFHKGKELYAFNRAKEFITSTSEAIVCEGYTDVIAMHEAGFTNCVAALGTALTIDHIRKLERCKPERIILMFDGDSAGMRAAQRAVLFISDTSADLRCVILPDKLDPAEFLDRHKASAMHKQLREARPVMDFVLETLLASYDVSVPGNRVAALKAGAELLAPLKKSVLLDNYATRLADSLGADLAETKRLIRAASIQDVHRPQSDNHQAMLVSEAQAASHQHENSHAIQAPLQLLSADERSQLHVERELVSQLVQHPSHFRQYATRLTQLLWADARHEAIAWAILAAPDDISPGKAVTIATTVVREAPQLLAGGAEYPIENMNIDESSSFLVDTVELYSTRRKIRSIKAQLMSDTELPDETSRNLLQDATQLQRHATELTERIRVMIDEHENG